MKIRSAFVHGESLFMLTWDWLVYQVPYANFANSFGKMLFNITPKKFGEAFHSLDEYKDFWKDREYFTNIYKLHTSRDFLFFDGNENVKMIKL